MLLPYMFHKRNRKNHKKYLSCKHVRTQRRQTSQQASKQGNKQGRERVSKYQTDIQLVALAFNLAGRHC